VNRMFWATIGLLAVVSCAAGCGSNTAPPPPDGKAPVAGGNSRIKLRPEYKKLLGNGENTHFKPSQFKKPPQGIP
jgi:hypothetical protein